MALINLLHGVIVCLAHADPEFVDVAIIGAGYSGLAAARQLHQNRDRNNVSFHIVEARNRVGGRTLNLNLATGNDSEIGDDVIELGGEWLAPEHTEAIRIFRDELGFELFHRLYNTRLFQSTTGHRPDPYCPGVCPIVVHTSAGTFNATTQDDVLKVLPEAVQQQISSAKAALMYEVARTPCADPFANPNARELDATTWDRWEQDHASAPEARGFMTGYADQADSVSQLSALGVAWVLNCTGVVGSNDEDYSRIRGGSQGPALQMAQSMAASLTLNSPVTSVRRQGDRWEVLSANKRLLAKHVLFAGLPPALLLGVEIEPALPGRLMQVLQRLPLGNALKYMVVYRTPWWRARGYLGKVQSLDNRIQSGNPYTIFCNDNSPYSWSSGVILCFVTGDAHRSFEDLSADERLTEIRGYMARSFGGEPTDGSADVLNVSALSWADEAYSRGAYSMFMPPGVLTSFWPTLAPLFHENRLGPNGLWIAGSDWCPEGQGYIEGALRSGRLAAERILQASMSTTFV